MFIFRSELMKESDTWSAWSDPNNARAADYERKIPARLGSPLFL